MLNHIYRDRDQFMAALKPPPRLLGVDMGRKRTGLAITNAELTVATPLEIVETSSFTLLQARLERLCAEEGIAGLVVGMPFNDGQHTRQSQSILGRVKLMDARPVLLWDEHMTSWESRQLTQDRYGHLDGGRVDALAAAVLLTEVMGR